jgi:hypothetical protein
MKRDSVVALCRPCHSSYDAYELDLLDYLTLDEQLEAVRVLGSIARAFRRLAPLAFRELN